ncbi:MAG: ATP-binding protein [Deltaproteobacteria bacterium]|nr:ATP-binding protein [Deltaproteobacteria bacterium]
MRRALVCLWVVAAATAHAERLATHTYTTADGLANDRVDGGAADARGYLWFATVDGVSRFDGHEFVNFGVVDGLPSSVAAHVLAAADGTIWVATDRGIAWLDPMERGVAPRFHPLPGAGVNRMLEVDHTIYAATDAGLVTVTRSGTTIVPVRPGHEPAVLSLAYDPADHSLWLGTWAGLVHRRADGTITQHPIHPIAEAPNDDRVFSLAIDHHHRLWIGWVGSIILAIPLDAPLPAGPLWDAAPAHADWLRFEPTGWARRGILVDSRDTVWIGATMGVVRYDGTRFEELHEPRLGVHGALAPCLEDGAGNVWFGSDSDGIVRLAPGGLVAYREPDGLDSDNIHGFAEAHDGTLYAITFRREGHALARFDGHMFSSTRPALPVANQGWAWVQPALIDRDGRWWMATGEGIARFAPGGPVDMLRQSDGLPGRDVLRIFEDSRGDIWLSTLSPAGLARWDRATNRVITLPSVGAIGQFAEDHHGAVWIASTQGLFRVDHDTPSRILGDDSFAAVLVDAHDRVWAGTERAGVVLVEPRRRWGVAQGLWSEQVQSLVDDADGRIYIGTTRGIDRLDPATGDLAHFGRADGLSNESIVVGFRAHDNALWFGTKAGAVRLVPFREPPMVAPPTYITRVAVSGQPTPLAFGGEMVAPALSLGPTNNQLDITFTTPSFAIGAPLRYEYRLGHQPWSAPQNEHTIHLANLAPGNYRFEVRALLSSVIVAVSAHVDFEILPPLYLRAWFLALAALLLIAATYALYRWRLAHLLAVERVRSRIASDLHDEIGSSLSRISILSELASRRAAAHEDVHPQIDVIGSSARELVTVASDIVWATDPRRDDLGSLIVRLRTFAADVLESRNITWTLDAPADPTRIPLDPERRRHLYLILKEAIHNAARHSHATHVAITLHADGAAITATVRDDGRGFDPAALPGTGNGLTNMRARATAAGGTLDIRHDSGTEITLRL